MDKNGGNALPLVSIGIPTRNRAHLLPIALNSLLKQTYKNIEFIISDNASKDDTEKLCREFALKDRRIAYTRQRESIPGMDNFAYVLSNAHGKYFMWASDDDWWDKDFVQKCVDALEKNSQYGVAMSWFKEKQIGGPEEKMVMRTHNYNNMTFGEMYKRALYGKFQVIFFFGLYRTELISKLFARKWSNCFNGSLIFLSDVALSTHVYSVPKFLHTRIQDVRPLIERHPDHALALAHEDPLSITKYVCTLPYRLLTSSAIPIKRKFLIFLPYLERTWKYKRKIIREIWQFVKRKTF